MSRLTAAAMDELYIFSKDDINCNVILGRGQFGTVYAGLARASGERVATSLLETFNLRGAFAGNIDANNR